MKWRRLVSSSTPRRPEPVSIWSVRAHDAKTFFRVAGLLWLVAVAFIVYKTSQVLPQEAAGPVPGAWRRSGDFALAVLAEFGTVGISIAILAMLLTRAANTTGVFLMSLYQAMVNRFVIPVIEAHKAEGREKGRQEVLSEWRAWNERRLAAEREGRDFGEPVPGERLVAD